MQERHDSKQRLEQTEADLYDPEDEAATQDFNTEITKDEHISDLMKARNKYNDVAAAAQELFDQSESSDEDPDDHCRPIHRGTLVDSNGSSDPNFKITSMQL